ncbi:MAG: hypothetical protein NTW28_24175 [Candidatus Solibacter sp.]|nr:hypothetical protein [Candidatus Solibacter sp.]
MRLGRWLCYLLLATAAVATDKEHKDSGRRTFRLEWRDLNRMVRGRNIDIALPSGIQLNGRVTSVEEDALMLDVRKTSNKRAYPKGRAVVPRPEVTEFTLARKEGHAWSAVGVSVGGSIGAGVAAGVVQVVEGDGRRALGAALAVGIPAALGYGLGWAADHEYVNVIVVPDGTGRAPAQPKTREVRGPNW